MKRPIYSVSSGRSDQAFYSLSKRDAIREAQEEANHINAPVEVEANFIKGAPTLALIVDILNIAGWCSRSEIVATIQPNKNARKEED